MRLLWVLSNCLYNTLWLLNKIMNWVSTKQNASCFICCSDFWKWTTTFTLWYMAIWKKTYLLVFKISTNCDSLYGRVFIFVTTKTILSYSNQKWCWPHELLICKLLNRAKRRMRPEFMGHPKDIRLNNSNRPRQWIADDFVESQIDHTKRNCPF